MQDTPLRRPAAWRGPAAGLGAIAALSVLVPLPILLTNGWPGNDDWLATFERIEAFRRAYATGAWYPVWTPFCQLLYGSPYPLFYHRLYTTIGAWLAYAGVPVLDTVRILTVALLLLGGAGMRRLLRVSGASELLASAGGALFVVAPYTRSNWFSRGAMAEFTAMMLLPWLFAELCLWWQGKRHPIRLACGFVLLFHAHSVIALYFLWSTLALLVVTLLPSRRGRVWAGWRGDLPREVAAGVVLAVGVALPVLVSWSLQRYFNLFAVMGSDHSALAVDLHFRPFGRYLLDDFKVDRASHDRSSLEVNRFVLGGLLLLHVIPGVRERWRRERGVPLLGFLLILSAACMVLQLRAFAWGFRVIPLGRFTQFPWRLLAFVTVGSIFFFVSAARATLAEAGWTRRLAGGAVASVVVLSIVQFGMIRPNLHDTYARVSITHALAHLDEPDSGGEYMLAGRAKNAFATRQRPFLTAEGCGGALRVLEPFEQGTFRLTADLAAPCRISLRQMQTPVLSLAVENATLLSRAPAETWEIELHPGHSSVSLRPHTYLELVVNALLGRNRG